MEAQLTEIISKLDHLFEQSNNIEQLLISRHAGSPVARVEAGDDGSKAAIDSSEVVSASAAGEVAQARRATA